MRKTIALLAGTLLVVFLYTALIVRAQNIGGASSTGALTLPGNLTVQGTCTGCGGGTPAYPLTVSGVTSGGVIYASSTTVIASSALLTNAHLMLGGGAGGSPTVDSGCSTNTIGTLTCGALQGNTHSSGAGHIFVETNTAPTVAAAGCGGSGASITSNNGSAAFKVNVGTSNTGTCTITLPIAATDWVCMATDITTTSTAVSTTKSVPTGGSLTTKVTLQNYTDISGTGAWVDSDVIEVMCHGE